MEKSGLENFRFEPEIPKNYNSDKKPIGRVDLKFIQQKRSKQESLILSSNVKELMEVQI